MESRKTKKIVKFELLGTKNTKQGKEKREETGPGRIIRKKLPLSDSQLAAGQCL